MDTFYSVGYSGWVGIIQSHATFCKEKKGRERPSSVNPFNFNGLPFGFSSWHTLCDRRKAKEENFKEGKK
jgi:hypothetical protein